MAVGCLHADLHGIDRINFVEMMADRLWGHLCAISFDLHDRSRASRKVLRQRPTKRLFFHHTTILAAWVVRYLTQADIVRTAVLQA